MATGIVSTAAHALGFVRIASALFQLNIAAYVLLCVLYAWRVIRYWRRAVADLFDHLASFGYFTFVAATCILGAQFIIFSDNERIAMVLWWAGLFSWIFFTYVIFAGLSLKRTKPALEGGIGGAWLLAVVATQSVALLSLHLASRFAEWPLNFFALALWLWGGMLYIWIIALIFYRYTFLRLTPENLLPPYWINMGAMAIATLVGAALIVSAPNSDLFQSLLPFLKGITLFYWAAGTWWLPLLLILGVWRHLWRRYPLSYDPLYWSVVFPLGMYAACTHALRSVFGITLLSRRWHFLCCTAGVDDCFHWCAAADGACPSAASRTVIRTLSRFSCAGT